MSGPRLNDPDAVVRLSLEHADAAVTTNLRAARDLERLLADADRMLGRKLTAWNRANGGDAAAFTPNGIQAYRVQIRLALEGVRGSLSSQLSVLSDSARAAAVRHAIEQLRDLDRAFTGIVRPLRIPQALRLSNALHGDRSSLLRQHATSVDRYGAAMIGQFEQRLATGLVGGLSQYEMTGLLTGHRGPRGEVSLRARVEAGRVVRTQVEQIPAGLFTRYRSWAWRIVRTEVSYAYNAAKLDSFSELRRELPTLKKKIVAHFDRRTAADSIAVHGQVRDVDGPDSYFVDGDARSYQHPPARPNDRETVIPWLPEWGEAESTRQLRPSEVQRADRAVGTARGPVAPGATVADRRAGETAARMQRRVDRLAGPPSR